MTALQVARRLIARAEKRARTCGGRPHEYISEEMFEQLKRAAAPKRRKEARPSG